MHIMNILCHEQDNHLHRVITMSNNIYTYMYIPFGIIYIYIYIILSALQPSNKKINDSFFVLSKKFKHLFFESTKDFHEILIDSCKNYI